MKALITAAGLGKRSGLDGKFRKEMLPIYDLRNGNIVLRPILDCIINHLTKAGIDEFVVVLDPKDRFTKDYLLEEFESIEIVYQKHKRGFGDAVLAARDVLNTDQFILNAGDGIILDQKHLNNVVRTYNEQKKLNVLTIFEVPNPERYGTAEVETYDSYYKVKSVVEKSKNPPSNLAISAFYLLNSRVFHYLERAEGNNIELTDAINKTISEGIPTIGLKIKRENWMSVGVVTEYVKVLQQTLDYSTSLKRKI